MVSLRQLVHRHLRAFAWATISQIHETHDNLINRNKIQHRLWFYLRVRGNMLTLGDTVCHHHHHVAAHGLIAIIRSLYRRVRSEQVVFVHVGAHALNHLISLNKRPYMRHACLHQLHTHFNSTAPHNHLYSSTYQHKKLLYKVLKHTRLLHTIIYVLVDHDLLRE